MDQADSGDYRVRVTICFDVFIFTFAELARAVLIHAIINRIFELYVFGEMQFCEHPAILTVSKKTGSGGSERLIAITAAGVLNAVCAMKKLDCNAVFKITLATTTFF